MADVYFKIGYFDPRDNQWHEGQPPVVQQQPQSNQVVAGQSGQSTAYRQPQQVAVGANAPQYYYPQQGQVAIGMNSPQYYYPQQQIPYTQVQQSTYYNPGGVPTQVALGVPGGPLVRYNYRPQQYNTGMNYGPWYGQQSYATRAPYAPNQPYYETVIGSDGRPRTIRMGEYEQMQPTHYETFYNSQGQLVQVPQYPAMNNSAVPVRRADQIVGGPNQPVASSTTSSVATTPRVRSMPEPVPNQQYIEERNTNSNQRLTNEELNALTGTTTETTHSSTPTTTTITPTNSDVIPPITEDQAERLRDIYGRDLDVNLFWGWLNSSSDKNSVQRVLNREEVIPDTQVQTFRTLRYPVLSPLGEALRDRLMEEEAQ